VTQLTEADLTKLRATVYQTLADEGRAPSPGELARRLGLSPAQAQTGLRALAHRHALVLTEDGDAVRMAHPFSAAPMAFVVTPADGRDDRRWWGGCAWDSFGISAALELDVLIDTACPACGSRLQVETGPKTAPPAELAVWFPRPAAQWWDDVVGTCTAIRLFCDAAHAQARARDTGQCVGRIVPAMQVWTLAAPWYGDRLAPAFTPHSREHNQRLLDDVGLSGSFWQLP
jgi:Alkylmercury lyase